jgi:hypothetical protein
MPEGEWVKSRQVAEIPSVECVNRGLHGRPLRRKGGRFLLAAAVAWAAAWSLPALGQDDPAEAGAPAAEEAEDAPEASPTPEATPAEGAAPAEADAAQGDPAVPEEQPEQGEAGPETLDQTQETDVETGGRKAAHWFRGSFEAGFDGAWSDGENDFDLDQTIRLQVDPPDWPRVHFRGALWFSEDLDSDAYYRSAIRDYNDTYDSGVRANLLYLYADVDDLWGDSVLRIGRQRIIESPLYNLVDGLYFKQRLSGWEWYVYGGARGSIYFDTHEDEVLGGGVAFQATPQTRIALDGFYGNEERPDDDIHRWWFQDILGWSFPRRVHSDLDDNYFALSLWQYFSPGINFFTRFGVQDGDADDLIVSVNGVVPKADVAYELTYRRQFSDNDDQVNDLTVYYRVLGELEEFDDLLLSLHKPLGKIYTLSLEGQWHDSDADSTAYGTNRDFQRYAVILAADELVPTVDASVALEYWDVDEGEGTWAITGEVSKTWERFKLTVGADYERYEDRLVRYNPWPNAIDQARIIFVPGSFPTLIPWTRFFDTYWVETHIDIHSIYTKLEYELAEDQDVSLKVTYEEDDSSQSPYWRVQAGYTINF